MRDPTRALAYYRTSSKSGVGEDKDSLPRQREAVERYAAQHGIEVVESFYDAAVTGTMPFPSRPEAARLLALIETDDGIGAVLVEDANRFARDLVVQIVGHQHLSDLGVDLVPVNAPDHFREDTPTAVLIRNVIGAFAQYQKDWFVHTTKLARARIRASGRKCEGRPAMPEAVVAWAREIKKGRPTASLREIAAMLAEHGHVNGGGKPYKAEQVRRMLNR